MKDNFSLESDRYAKYRPRYPRELFDYLNSIVSNKRNAWDCGTGNGQVAFELAKTFNTVYATDISQSQINNALHADNIIYSVQPAEQTDFQDDLFDLIIVAQAIHWFDFERFYSEVKRTAKKRGLLCVIGYGKAGITKELDEIIERFYNGIIGPYWDKERRYIEEGYRTIPFPFRQLDAPDFLNTMHWNLDHLIGYLNTWSAVKHYIKVNHHNPVNDLHDELQRKWGNAGMREVKFPLLLRMGQIWA